MRRQNSVTLESIPQNTKSVLGGLLMFLNVSRRRYRSLNLGYLHMSSFGGTYLHIDCHDQKGMEANASQSGLLSNNLTNQLFQKQWLSCVGLVLSCWTQAIIPNLFILCVYDWKIIISSVPTVRKPASDTKYTFDSLAVLNAYRLRSLIMKLTDVEIKQVFTWPVRHFPSWVVDVRSRHDSSGVL